MAFKFPFTGLVSRVNARFRRVRGEDPGAAERPPAQAPRPSRPRTGSKGSGMYIIARNIKGPRLQCEALMVDKKTFTPWPPVTEDGWRRAYKFRDRLMAEVVRMEADPMGEELKVIEAVYIR
ncbi:hypothetical protein [Methylocapsa palsarum]|uniref:Uncharacterized protein n=1 Tax=Methylocapsa palsarum TaxID=1612308 RepID=A0A1I3YR85_9HYPH|nr:hypothetical protein [Methylocapsa palsarum]SFK34293.1 hypothetical protein SAMN05444581_106120 [Methylocapsa palsarum]